MTKRERNREIVTAFYTTAFVEGHHEDAARRYLHPDYVQHNPFVPDGIEGFVAWFADFDLARDPGFSQRILRVIADEDLVAVHATMTSPDSPHGVVLVDIFAIDDDGLITEHWDVFKEMSDPATIPHDNGEIGDVVTVAQGDADRHRWALVDFYTMAFVQKRFVQAAAKHFGERYVQHNSFVADGADEFVRHFGGDGPHAAESYCQIPLRFIVDGEYGLVHEWLRPNVLDPDDLGVMIVDIFRFDDGKIVEHWDVFTPRWADADAVNTRGML